MALPYFEDNGWNADVLAIHPETISAPLDPSLLELLPENFSPHLTEALPLSLSRIPGLGTLSGRAFHALKRTGNKLIKSRKFDLIFFSTTQFGVFTLGPYWKQKWGIPFALDLQDPWINFFYRDQKIKPPGGVIKFQVQQWLAGIQAQKTIPAASGLCAVSEDYINYFARQEMITSSCRQITLPFAFSEQDWAAARKQTSTLPWHHIDPSAHHWVYAGRGGDDLIPCLRALFRSLANSPARSKPLHLWFIGTHYGIRDNIKNPIEILAAECNCPNVHEIPQRLPYLEALHIMNQSDGLMVPGSIDPRYQPSKLIPLLASGKPLLALAPDTSPCAKLMEEIAPENLITYSLPFKEAGLSEKLSQLWQEEAFQLPDISENTMNALSQREAAAATVRLCDFFKHCTAHA